MKLVYEQRTLCGKIFQAIAGAGFLIFASASASAQMYTPTILGTFRTGNDGNSFARGVNDADIVVGGAETDSNERVFFRWSRSTGIINLGQLVVPFGSYGNAINSNGEACGYATTRSGGFASGWRQNGSGPLIDLLETGGGGDSVSTGIADDGTIVGWSNQSQGCGSPLCAGNPGHGVKWIGTVPTLLPDLGGYFSVAMRISPDGHMICGYGAMANGETRGYRLRSGASVPEVLEPLAGDTFSIGNCVNNAGEVVGFSMTTGGVRHAVRWTGTTAISVGPAANPFGSEAVAINASGTIVGYVMVSATGSHGAKFSASGPPIDLNDVMTGASGWVCTNADDINSRGTIVGAASNGAVGRAIVLSTCAADFNGDSAVDFFDYLDFVDAFSSGSANADFNRDGVVDFFDYLDFVDAFSIGC